MPPPPSRPISHYIQPSGFAAHAAYACQGSQEHDKWAEHSDQRAGTRSHTSGPGGGHRTDSEFDLACKAATFCCVLAYAASWEKCGGNPTADPGVAAAVAALSAPSESLIFLGQPLHGSACTWCTSGA